MISRSQAIVRDTADGLVVLVGEEAHLLEGDFATIWRALPARSAAEVAERSGLTQARASELLSELSALGLIGGTPSRRRALTLAGAGAGLTVLSVALPRAAAAGSIVTMTDPTPGDATGFEGLSFDSGYFVFWNAPADGGTVTGYDLRELTSLSADFSTGAKVQTNGTATSTYVDGGRLGTHYFGIVATGPGGSSPDVFRGSIHV